jgi:hypothetical protein
MRVIIALVVSILLIVLSKVSPSTASVVAMLAVFGGLAFVVYAFLELIGKP